MKTIKLKLSDEVLATLKDEIGIRKLTDNLNGIIDEFILILIKAINEKKSQLSITKK